MRKLLHLSCLFFLVYVPAKAAHITGGEITYECLGYTNGDSLSNSRTYRFTMRIYRDCQGNGADFDSAPGGAFATSVSIYQGTNLFTTLYLVPKITFFLPNAFTPNDDGRNDVYQGEGFLRGIKNFRLMIWNRWGEEIFNTTDPHTGWNGRKQNSGKLSPPGVYLCLVQYAGPRGETNEIKGFATLVR